jgi:hypothetical protein
MKTSPDLAVIQLTHTAEELVDAHVTFVRGVVYQCDLPEAPFVTPKATFNSWCCDCWPLVKRGKGFALKPGFELPIPVKETYLGDPVAVITEGFPQS